MHLNRIRSAKLEINVERKSAAGSVDGNDEAIVSDWTLLLQFPEKKMTSVKSVRALALQICLKDPLIFLLIISTKIQIK